jgi:hypothetical protein
MTARLEALNHLEIIARGIAYRVSQASTELNGIDRDRKCFVRQLAQCDKELKKWEAVYVDDIITAEGFKAKKNKIDVCCSSAHQEILRLDEQQCELAHAVLETAVLKEYCARERAHLSSFSMDEEQRALAALQIEATWHPDKPLEIKRIISLEIAHSTPGCAASLARH